MSDEVTRADLPHEVIECDYGPRDVEWRIKHIRKVATKRIRLRRVEHSSAFLVAHRSTWLQSQCVSSKHEQA
jgi:hypothetical protein